jgi:probable phosphoglycerate mutase
MTTFFLIRHGNTTVGDKIVGRQPGVHLSESGKRQAEELADRLSPVVFTAIFSSPLERTQETARPLARLKALEVHVVPGLYEIEFGDWTNARFDELESVPQWKRFHTFRSGTGIPGGERMIEVQSRMIAVIEQLRRDYPDGTLALFSHGDPIRSVIAYYAGVPLDLMLRLTVDTASVSVIAVDEYGANLLCMNHTGILPRQ